MSIAKLEKSVSDYPDEASFAPDEYSAPEQIAVDIFTLVEKLRDSDQDAPHDPDDRMRLKRLFEAQLARHTDLETAMEFRLRSFRGADDIEIGGAFGDAKPHDVESLVQAYDSLDEDSDAARVVLAQIAILQPIYYPHLLRALGDERLDTSNLRQLSLDYMARADDDERSGSPASAWWWRRTSPRRQTNHARNSPEVTANLLQDTHREGALGRIATRYIDR